MVPKGHHKRSRKRSRRFPTRRRGGGSVTRERGAGVTGPQAKECPWPLKLERGKGEMHSPLQPPEGARPYHLLDFTSVTDFELLASESVRE